MNVLKTSLAGLALVLGVLMLRPAYAIDPVAKKNVVETLSTDQRFNTLVKLIKRSDVEKTLEEKGLLTLVAPTDEAFAALPKKVRDRLFEDKDYLERVLKFHIAPGSLTSGEMVQIGNVETVRTKLLKVRIEDKQVWVNDARMIQANIPAFNGMIHVIDKVLIPSDAFATQGK